MKNVKMEIPLSPIVKIVKAHANTETAIFNPGHAAKTSRKAVEKLQEFLDEIAHIISEEASKEAALNGKSTIRPIDMDNAIALVKFDMDLIKANQSPIKETA